MTTRARPTWLLGKLTPVLGGVIGVVACCYLTEPVPIVIAYGVMVGVIVGSLISFLMWLWSVLPADETPTQE